MSPLILYFKKRPHLLILGLILLIGLFFRTYKIITWFDFSHDADLFSWIIKDIVINHHFRLIGQLTSAPGIFIGPLFYYLLAPFFILTKMDPIGTLIPIVIIGILTIFSYYYVFSRLFNKKIGLIGAFLYAVLFSTIDSDRWIVPTVTTSIWSVWYFYFIAKLSRKDFSVLPFLGILIGLIWHIHIALAPILITIPLAMILAGKLPNLKQIIFFLIVTLITSSPLILFEARHNFSQTKSFISNLTANFGAKDSISENKEVIFNSQNNNAKLNLDSTSKFSLEIEPQTPKIGDTVNLKITSKNAKYSTLAVLTDCGDPSRFEIGSINAVFNWSTTTCQGSNHKITITARIPTDPPFKIILGKFINVLDKENTNIENLFIFPISLPKIFQYLIAITVLFAPLFAWKIKSFTTNQILICYTWILSVFLFFSFSSIIVSEYYLASITVILILSTSTILYKIYQIKPYGKYFILLLLLFILIKSFFYYITFEKYNKGYLEKKDVVQFISLDAKQKGFPCIGINYITTMGENVGFRYFFWLEKTHLIKPTQNIPVYNIVIPNELSQEVTKKFGHIGIIPPTTILSKEAIQKSCQNLNTNLTDSVFGYVD